MFVFILYFTVPRITTYDARCFGKEKIFSNDPILAKRIGACLANNELGYDLINDCRYRRD